MFRNILIVCHANVCRSPAAEMLFKSHTASRGGPRVTFHSAGCARTTATASIR